MKKFSLLLILLTVSSFSGLAAANVVGSWDCVAIVDQEYPFVLTLKEANGELSGTAETSYGQAGPVKNVVLEENVLKFSVDHPSAGLIDFEATVDGDSLEGSLEGWDFGGEFKGTRKN